MDESMYSISDLKSMQIIDINLGLKLGFVKDFKIDCENHKILSLLLPSHKISWLKKNEDIEIPWERVKKIGVDIILIDGSDLSLNNES